jgi:flagellar hook assembly protein FlgD
MDPDTTTGGYYRSMVAQPGLTSDDVTEASGAGTTDDPSNLIVPGNAQVVGDGAQLFDDATLDPAGLAVAGTVASGARMRVLAEAPADPVSGATPVQVQGIDDPDLTGWMDASALVPKDSAAPALWNVAASTRISPNGDGRSDSASLTARVSETADWRFRIKAPGGATIVDRTGHGTAVDLSWDALTGGAAVADGAYTWSLQATDTWENGPTTKTGTITVDTKAPNLAAVTPPSSEVRWISPNGDLAKESMTWATTMSETGSLRLKVADPDGVTVRSTTFSAKGGASATATWDGKDSDGAVVPDGTYKITLTPRDTAGTDGKAVTRSLVVDTSLGDVDATKTLFFPQDGDGLAKTTTLRFTLTRPAVVTWTLVDADGDVAMTLLDGASLPAGQVTRVFDGKLPDGTYLPRGAYRSTVTLAGDSAPVISQYRTITLRAFIPTASDTTPGRGQKVTIYATSAETLSGNPRVYVTQPGKATWSVATSKVSTCKYKATLTIKTGGASGTIRFRVTGTDTGDGKQSADLSLPLH